MPAHLVGFCLAPVFGMDFDEYERLEASTVARHSTGTQNNKVAGSFVVLIVAVITAIALGAWWLIAGKGDDSATTASEDAACSAGELTLAVAGDDPTLLKDVVNKYNGTSPVINSYCVTATATDSLQNAAVYLTSASDEETIAKIKSSDRTNASLDWPVIATVPVGVATKTDFTFGGDTPITYATKDNALASAFVAAVATNAAAATDDATATITAALNSGTDTTVRQAAAEGADNIALPESALPSGYSFVPATEAGSAVSIPQRAVILNTTNAVTEDAIAAATDFVSTQSTASDNPLSTVTGIAAMEALSTFAGAASPTTESAAATSSAVASAHQVQNTLFLLDTSDAMGAALGQTTWYNTAANAITDASLRIGAAGKQVALWNYSSPMSEGVTQGWRVNVGLDDTTGGQSAAAAVVRFGTGGQPQTRSALSAALKSAAEVSEEVRVVLIVSGTADTFDLQSAIDAAKAGGVTLDVINVGETAPDPGLATAAAELGGTSQQATAAEQLAGMINKAVGLN